MKVQQLPWIVSVLLCLSFFLISQLLIRNFQIPRPVQPLSDNNNNHYDNHNYDELRDQIKSLQFNGSHVFVGQVIPELNPNPVVTPFPKFEVYLLDTDETNGMRMLFDSPTDNHTRGTKFRITSPLTGNPQQLSRMIPSLVCDLVVISVTYGRLPDRYDLPLKWRIPYFRKQPGTCQLHFQTESNGFSTKLQAFLLAIKLISNAKIISSHKFQQLLDNDLIEFSHHSKQPWFKSHNIDSISTFRSIVTPHGTDGVGVPYYSDAKDYPVLFFMDADAFVTNTHKSVSTLYSTIKLSLQNKVVLAPHKGEIMKHLNAELADIIIAADQECMYAGNETGALANTGVLIFRPTRMVADILRLGYITGAELAMGDQAGVIWALDQLLEFDRLKLIETCYYEFYDPSTLKQVLSVMFPDKSRLSSESAQRLALIHKFENRPPNFHSADNQTFGLFVHGRWMNPGSCGLHRETATKQWQPGDWLAHLAGCSWNPDAYKYLRNFMKSHRDIASWPDDDVDMKQFDENGLFYLD